MSIGAKASAIVPARLAKTGELTAIGVHEMRGSLVTVLLGLSSYRTLAPPAGGARVRVDEALPEPYVPYKTRQIELDFS